MRRYDRYADIITTSTVSKRRYSTIYYPTPARKSTDIYMVSKRSDRLDLLANRYYNDPQLWVILAKTNRLKSLIVPPGTHLRIPFPFNADGMDDDFRNKQF